MRKSPADSIAAVEQNLADLAVSRATSPLSELDRWIVITPHAQPLAYDIDDALNVSNPRIVPISKATRFSKANARSVSLVTLDDDDNCGKAVHLRDAYSLIRNCLERELRALKRSQPNSLGSHDTRPNT